VTLYLTAEHLDAIALHAQRTYPQECCGLLLGHCGNGDSRVVDVRPTTNAWSDDVMADLEAVIPSQNTPHSQRDRYWIDPRELLVIHREARDRQLSVIGVYHSHPDHVAEPSECDRCLAWPDYSYLIVSVMQGVAQDLLSWKLNSDHQFQVEEIRSIPHADGATSIPPAAPQFLHP
jgi:proteasome lid subunit RPN8/RPN11